MTPNEDGPRWRSITRFQSITLLRRKIFVKQYKTKLRRSSRYASPREFGAFSFVVFTTSSKNRFFSLHKTWTCANSALDAARHGSPRSYRSFDHTSEYLIKSNSKEGKKNPKRKENLSDRVVFQNLEIFQLSFEISNY